MKQLIVNADDFGFSDAANAGIVTAHQQGIVSSTSLMVNMPAAWSAAALAKGLPRLGVGLHLNLSCGTPLSSAAQVPSLVDAQGHFWSMGQLLLRLWTGRIAIADVVRETQAQFDAFANLGLRCTHFDGHRHVHCLPQLFPQIARVAQAHGINKCRISLDAAPTKPAHPQQYFSLAYWAQYIKAQLLRGWSQCCRAQAQELGLIFPQAFYGVVAMSERGQQPFLHNLIRFCSAPSNEIMCHPAKHVGAGEFMEGYTSVRRQHELEQLTHADAIALVAQHELQLISYAQL